MYSYIYAHEAQAIQKTIPPILLSPFQHGIYRKSILNPSRYRFRTRAPPPGRSASMTAAGGRAART